jgi:cold shock CspA family protein
LAIRIRNAGSVAHQPADFGNFTRTPHLGSSNVFYHKNNLRDPGRIPKEGDAVSYRVFGGQGGRPKAIDVEVITAFTD